jgi:transcriptional regulator with XRE-family HTH domain
MNIGTRVKELRERYDISQGDLSRKVNISQPQISRIEAGQGTTIKTVRKVAEFFDVTVDYLLQPDDDLRMEQKNEFTTYIRLLTRNHQFKEIERLFKTSHLLFKTPEELQFFYWHQGIIQSGLYANFQKAVQFFDQAIQSIPSNLLTRRQVEISMSQGVALLEANHLEEARITFENAEKDLRSINVPYDPESAIRLAYNRSATYYELRDFRRSAAESLKGLELCRKHGRYYLFGELNYQYGLCHFYLGKANLANEYITGSIFLFKTDNQEKWAQHARNKLIELGFK